MKKIAIVTGASSGMGRDFALLLSEFVKVDEIWVLARRIQKLKALAGEIEEKSGIHTRAIEIDLSGRSGVSAFGTLLECERILCQSAGASRAAEAFGSVKSSGTSGSSTESGVSGENGSTGFEISLLVNNAGFGTYGTFEETDIQKELDMIDLNVTSLTGITGYALPYMNKGSILINTASLASFLPLGNFAVYGATKAYVLSFSMALAAELKEKGVKVCALCPGPVLTEFANVASNGARKIVKNGEDCTKVVRHCLKNAVKGRKYAIYALKWKFKAFASRFVDRYLGAWFTYKYCKRPNGTNGVV